MKWGDLFPPYKKGNRQIQIQGTFKFGDMEFEYEGEKAYDAYRALRKLSHKVFLKSWYEEITGMVYEEDDFPWLNAHYLNERKLKIAARVVFDNREERYKEIYDTEERGEIIVSY